MDKSLLLVNVPLISVAKDHYDVITKLQCSQHIILMEEADSFDKLAPRETLLKIFKPWTRIIFIFSHPPNLSSFYEIAINEMAIQIITIEILKIIDVRKDLKLIEEYKITIKNLNRNKEFTITNFDKQIKIPKFKSSRWVPKFSGNSSISIVLFECPPYVIMSRNGTLDGTEMIIIRETLKNVPYHYVLPPNDNEDGGLWFTSSKLVESGKKDMTVCSRWPITSINKSLDYTKSTNQACVTFLVKKPTLLPDAFFMFQTFEYQVFILSYFVLGLTPVIVTIIQKVYNDLFNQKTLDAGRHTMDMFRIFTGGSIVFKKVYILFSAKIILLFWLVFCLLLATYYSAGITSTSTKPRVVNVVNTLEDLVKYKIRWKLSNDDFQRDLYKMENPLFDALAKLYVKGKRIEDRTSTSAIFVKVIQKTFVNDIDNLPQDEQKYYKALTDCIGIYEGVFFLKKNSPLTELFNRSITRFVESGIAEFLLRGFIANMVGVRGHRTFFTNYVDNRIYSNIGMSKLVGPMALLVSGLMLSTVTFLIEILTFRFRKTK